MTVAPPEIGSEDAQAMFRARYGTQALFERHARARLRQLPVRQVATAIGVAILWIAVTPGTALAALCLALAGEAVEAGILAWTLARLKKGADFQNFRPFTAIAGALQALAVSGCIMLLSILAAGDAERLLALIFLMGAAINAGFDLTHSPLAARTKLAVFATCAVAVLAWRAWSNGFAPVPATMALLEVAILGYLTHSVVSFAARAWSRRLEKERDLLATTAALDGTIRDLSRSQAEAQRLALVASHANDSVIETDPDRKITWVNRAFSQITGYAFDEALGRHPKDLLDGPETDPKMAGAFEKAVRMGVPHRAEVQNYRKDGTQVWMDVNLVPVTGADGTVERVISIERDVTRMHEQAQALAEARDRAQAATRAKANFLAHMSHEIRTPLNAIIGMADLLSERELPARQHEEIEAIRSASGSLLKLVDNILDLSRLDADKLVMNQQVFSPSACLREVVTLMRPLADAKGLRLDMTHESQLPDKVLGDAGRLRQVLINLMGNAIKFTERGTISVTASARPNGEGWMLRVVVRDSGIGVPPERAEAIFEEFEQADPSTARRFDGTGLGLPISRALARRMGGDIVLLEKEEDAWGASFALTVRLARSTSEPADKGSRVAPLDTLPSLHILLAEDNATNRLLVARFLQDQPVTLTMAEDGRRAVEIVAETAPDIVLMDMAMPVLNGIAATREIRAAKGPQPRIIAITANALASDRAACLSAGMDDFLSKPVRKPDLMAALARTAGGQKGLSPRDEDTVSRPGTRDEASKWISPHASGTTNGRSIRSSDR